MLKQRLDIDLPLHSSDDPSFVDLVCGVLAGELGAKAAEEIFVVRVDNWFDYKWRNFSGIGRFAFASAFEDGQDTALHEFRQAKATFPPFSPERIVAEYCFVRDAEGAYSLSESARSVHSHRRESSCWNLHRRIANFSGSALFVWFSSRTQMNGRGSLMVYRVHRSRVGSWYASFSKKDRWMPTQTDGIGRARVRAWIEAQTGT